MLVPSTSRMQSEFTHQTNTLTTLKMVGLKRIQNEGMNYVYCHFLFQLVLYKENVGMALCTEMYCTVFMHCEVNLSEKNDSYSVYAQTH